MNTNKSFAVSAFHCHCCRVHLAFCVFVLGLLGYSFSAFGDDINDVSWSGDVTKVTALLKEHPDLVKSATDNGWTPLHNAAWQGYKSMVDLLLANKADVNAKTKSMQTPLHFAVLHGFKDVVGQLLTANADVNAKTADDETPLHLAAQCGDKDLMKSLLDAKADVNAQDNDGQSPLDDAVILGHEDIVELLTTKKADINAKDKKGHTPLDYANAFAHADTVAFLSKNGAKSGEAGTTQPINTSAVKDVGTKTAYEVALNPEMYGFEKGGGMVMTPNALGEKEGLKLSRDDQWTKHTSDGKVYVLTIHFDNSNKMIYAKWGGF